MHCRCNRDTRDKNITRITETADTGFGTVHECIKINLLPKQK